MSDPTSPETLQALSSFLPPTRAWFAATLGPPTPPQAQGWPSIQRGDHTLILAPTGSGKTLAAFLWGIDQIFVELTQPSKGQTVARKSKNKPQIRLLYISPLKALNNDIHRNLRVPLAGIRRIATEMGLAYPAIQVALRSGDTPQRERQAMLRKPPHILITTPESLYLLLTSPKARELFRDVRTVIVDEIHTLAGSKRGVHLALSLERLQHLASCPIQRIGLSATIRPLDEVARYLGGSEWKINDRGRTLEARPVSIVDAGYRKPLDLVVETVVEDFRNLPGESIWPSIISRVVDLIEQQNTTLIFANSRRLAERSADWLNEQMAAVAGSGTGLIKDGLAHGVGFMGAGTGVHASPIRAHHGSVSKEMRLTLERQLKEGRLPALVGTSSLELGIDIGTVDLVVQLQSPKAVAQGLQRVGRAGHLVGQTSRGRIFPTHREDIMEAAAVAGGMLRGEVEPIHTPRNVLDVLAQQIVAMVSVQNWAVDELLDLVQCAYPYIALTRRAFTAVLEMLTGRYPSQAYRELRARLVWDRVNDQLAALPGSRLLALTNGGTISDRGAFSAYLSDHKTKLGELDEEFVYETRVGDTLMLGSQVWRVVELTDDKVIVAGAAGATPRMPFWRGDFPWRSYALGVGVGAFRRIVAERVDQVRTQLDLPDCRSIVQHKEAAPVRRLLSWLRHEYALDPNSAWHVVNYVASQVDHSGAISSDRTVLVEVFDDALGDPRLVIQSPFGGRVNGLWGMALAGALRGRTGVAVEVQTNDDGILFRFPDAEADFPLDLVIEMGPDEARSRILAELPDSPVFGAQFRQNAARALLLPGLRGGKRTPFWLQRLRAKDLLQIVRQFDDFPIVAETYRDCLEEVLDLPHLQEVLTAIQNKEIEVVALESITPSPVAHSLLWSFVETYMYEWDAPKAERQLQTLSVNRQLLQDLLRDIDLSELLRSDAVGEVRARLQRTAPGAQARTKEELASLFQDLGDLSTAEIALRSTVDSSGWIADLASAQRIVSMMIPTTCGEQSRWVAAEYVPDYLTAFGQETDGIPAAGSDEACRRILERFLAQAGPVTFAAITARYAFSPAWLQSELDGLVASRNLAHGHFTPTDVRGEIPADSASPDRDAEYVERRSLEQMHRRTLTLLRREVRPVPITAYADFLARWQHIYPADRLEGAGALRQILQQLRAVPVVGRVWERDVLPLRLVQYRASDLVALCQGGEVVWVGAGGADPRRSRIRFLFRGEGSVFLEPSPTDLTELGEIGGAVYDFLRQEGAVFEDDICSGLDMTRKTVEIALAELVTAGLVTNDSLGVLQRIIRPSGPQPSAAGKPVSSLESHLAERLGPRTQRTGSWRRPGRSEFKAAQQRVRQRLSQTDESQPAGLQEGRWALVHRLGILGKAPSPAEQIARQARQLLARYGVVTRASLENEIGAWDWRLIYQELQRLEMRGEVRRGYFVQGLPGLQFALPEVVERLRLSAGSLLEGEVDSLVVMNACDPANIYGPAVDGGPERSAGEPLTFSRIPSTWLVLSRGLPVLLVENTGTDLTTSYGVNDGLAQRALAAWLRHAANFAHRVTVQNWNGVPLLESPGRSVLEAVGCYRDYPGMTWERPVSQ